MKKRRIIRPTQRQIDSLTPNGPRGQPLNYGNYQQLSKWPIIGPWSAALGQVIDIFATPCATNPEIWVKAAFNNLPILFQIFDTPFLLANKWEQLTGENNHRGSKSRLQSILEVDPENQPLKPAGWAVFKLLGDLALEAEWYFFIADKVSEFGVNWASMVYDYAGCRYPGDIHMQLGWSPGGIQYFGDIPQALYVFDSDMGDPPGASGYGPLIANGVTGYFSYKLSTSEPPEGWWLPHAKNISTNIYSTAASATQDTNSQGVSGDGRATNASASMQLGDQPSSTTVFATAQGDGWAIVDRYEWSFYGHRSGTRGLTHLL